MTIPVTIEYNGKTYFGQLSKVLGAASSATFHLMINNFYHGRLRYTEHPSLSGWVFDTNKLSEGWETLAEYFGWIVTAWADSHA